MKKTIKDYKKEITELKECEKWWCDRYKELDEKYTETLSDKKEVERKLENANNDLFDKDVLIKKLRTELNNKVAQLKGMKQAICLFAGTTKVECEENEHQNLCKHL